MEDFSVLPADTISPFDSHFAILIKHSPLLPRYLADDISAAVRWDYHNYFHIQNGLH